MFWKGRVSNIKQIELFLKQSDLQLIELGEPHIPEQQLVSGCNVSVSKLTDIEGISKLLNDWFEEPDARSKAHTTPEWIRSTFLENHAIWIVAKDKGGTIRGCISSFLCKAPFPNSLSGCGKPYPWGIVDWYCVHPLWRSKGLGSALLETLDFITYKIGRKAHVFLKEGYPLPFPHVPIYSTWLKCRKAGSNNVKQMSEDTGLIVELYHEIERSTGLPLIKVKGLTSKLSLNEWEDTLDNLPECWAFVSGDCFVDDKRGWKTDSLISMYAFRWSPGKWLGSRPLNI